MSRKHHELKTETRFYQAIEKGIKKFELRKNDRGFEVGDMLTLLETVNTVYTGRRLGPMEIKYIFSVEKDFGLQEGYCIMCW